MYSANIDKIGIKSLPSAQQSLFPPERTSFQVVSGTRTIVRCEEQQYELPAVYEAGQSLATILATNPLGVQHVTVTVTGEGNIPFASGPVVMAFYAGRCKIVPDGAGGSLVSVLSPFDNKTVLYNSTDSPATILATM